MDTARSASQYPTQLGSAPPGAADARRLCQFPFLSPDPKGPSKEIIGANMCFRAWTRRVRFLSPHCWGLSGQNPSEVIEKFIQIYLSRLQESCHVAFAPGCKGSKLSKPRGL